MLFKSLLQQPALNFVAFTGAYFTVEVEEMSPVFRGGVFEHGTENIWHVATVSFPTGELS